jgi:hypothetical protein
LNTPGNEMTLSGEVALKHAAPNTTYSVYYALHVPAAGPFCGAHPIGTVTTNGEGNSDFHLSVERLPGSTTFNVVIEREPLESFVSPAVELD